MAGRETKLVSMVIGPSGEANEIFGGKHRPNETPVVLIPNRRWCCPFITIPSGMYALVQVAGKDVNFTGTRTEGTRPLQYENSPVWPPGFHVASPFPCNERRISHLVTKQAVVFDTPIRGCKTADDVTVTIDVCLSFRIMGDVARGENPELVRKFVHELGPVELGRQLKDAQDERVRALARSVNHTEVYGLRKAGAAGNPMRPADGGEAKTEALPMGDGVGVAKPGAAMVDDRHADVTEEMEQSLNKQFNKYGVQIIDVAIQRVRLPPNFEKQMEEKTTYEAVIEEQKMRQMSEMQIIKQKEQEMTVTQKHKEEEEKEKVSGDKRVAETKKRLDEVIAETNKQVAAIREEEAAEVRAIKAAADLEVQMLESETAKILVEHDAQANAKAEKLRADTDAYIMKKKADAALVEAQNAAKAKTAIAGAEGGAAEALRPKRHFQLQKQQIAMYSALAENDRVVVTGKNAGQSLLADMMISQKQAGVMLDA